MVAVPDFVLAGYLLVVVLEVEAAVAAHVDVRPQVGSPLANLLPISLLCWEFLSPSSKNVRRLIDEFIVLPRGHFSKNYLQR